MMQCYCKRYQRYASQAKPLSVPPSLQAHDDFIFYIYLFIAVFDAFVAYECVLVHTYTWILRIILLVGVNFPVWLWSRHSEHFVMVFRSQEHAKNQFKS